MILHVPIKSNWKRSEKQKKEKDVENFGILKIIETNVFWQYVEDLSLVFEIIFTLNSYVSYQTR